MDLLTAPTSPPFTFTPSTTSTMAGSSNPPPAPPERNVRSRYVHAHGLVPQDDAMGLPDSMIEVDIEVMMSDNPEHKKAIMYLQLIHVVSGSSTGQNNSSVYQSYYKKNNKKDGSLSSHYYRLMLFRDVTSKCGQVVYIVEGKNVNDRLWSRYPLLHDNGVVTIGTYINWSKTGNVQSYSR